jgi:hypothetical protein
MTSTDMVFLANAREITVARDLRRF